ncbi:hypothetical protein PC123_g26082 [Phytophthora cactorum]|nr:hypothetical protein PC123_g26082 [Phytophthora cactorum]
MRLCGLHYVIKHIAGEDNLWADIVSHWHTCEVVRVAAVQTRSRHVAPLASISPLRPLFDDEFVFPTLDDIREAQSVAGQERSRLRVALEEVDGIVTIEGRPWIPNKAKELLARLFVVAHVGAQGHRGQDPMSTLLQQRLWITRINEKVTKFIRECLLCKHVKGPRIIPRPYGPTHNMS